MSLSQVTITRRGAERVRGGHLWVYRTDVRDASEVEGGAIVVVRDERGRAIGRAFYSSRSEIALDADACKVSALPTVEEPS